MNTKAELFYIGSAFSLYKIKSIFQINPFMHLKWLESIPLRYFEAYIVLFFST